MVASLSRADRVVLWKWARSYRYRWLAQVTFGILGIASVVGGVWNLAMTILRGRRLGLTAIETLTASRVVDPVESWRMVAMALPSYIMFMMPLISILVITFMRVQTQRYRVLLKLLPADQDLATTWPE